MLYSTSAILAQETYGDSLYFLKRQLAWVVLGFLAMWVVRSIPYGVQQRLAVPGLILTLVALVAVLLLGKEVGGARRWLMLGSLSIQPSELAKYVLLLFIARTLSLHTTRLDSFTAVYLPSLCILGLCFVLVLRQPDLGTAVIIAATASGLLLLAGVPWLYIGVTVGAALPVLYWALVHVGFRLERLRAFLNPWEDPLGRGYQVVQSLLALGQGKWFGIGLGQSQQKLFFLPEPHTDFIFAVIGEELGFFGCLGLIVLFLMLLWRILRIAVECREPFGSYLGLGIFILLTLQIVMNLGVVSGLLPTKGLPLPLISMGGSNLFVSLLAIGTMLNIAERST